jgi:hypothetical protein
MFRRRDADTNTLFVYRRAGFREIPPFNTNHLHASFDVIRKKNPDT